MKWKVSPVPDIRGFATDDVDETAARWSEILRDVDGDRHTREAFEAWRAESPARAAAFRRAEAAQALARLVSGKPELQAMRRETLARTQRAQPMHCVPRTFAYSIAASLAAVAALGLLIARPDTSRQMVREVRDAIAGNVYETGVGQRSVVKLDDGSVITLNTDSRVSVHYEPGTRAITLERGQALFKVAKDHTRPFIVTADGRQVTALGTEFEVHLSKRLFEVTLLEGRITVTRDRVPAPAVATAPTAELHPGQQFVATAAATPPRVRAADVKREVSWRHGQVVFENERLDDAVAEMNRYSRDRVVLSDARLASLKISGAFNTGDTGTFVEALTVYFPIERGTRGDDAIVLETAGADPRLSDAGVATSAVRDPVPHRSRPPRPEDAGGSVQIPVPHDSLQMKFCCAAK